MATISWKLTEKQEQYINDRHKYLLVEGSAGSGKTIFAVHKVILYALTHNNARIGVFRQTLPSLRMTAWLEIREALDNYGIPYKENKSEGVMTFPKMKNNLHSKEWIGCPQLKTVMFYPFPLLLSSFLVKWLIFDQRVYH